MPGVFLYRSPPLLPSSSCSSIYFFDKVFLCISVVLTVLKFAVKIRLVLNSQVSGASYSANQT